MVFSTQAFANQNIAPSAQSNSDIVPGQYIVILKDDVAPQEILKKYGVGKIHQYEHAFNGLAITASENQISALKSDSRVVYIESDTVVYASAQNIPPGIKRIGATQSFESPIVDFSDITIAILDTGIDFTHPDLNVDTDRSIVIANGKDANDKNGHGTHVAGTAAAINNGIGVVGVAQNANLIAVKVLGNGGSGFTSDIIEGIDYVAGLNDANPGTVDVINMSLGGSGACGSYQIAIDNVNNGNVTVVVAAGNDSDDAANHRPANCDGVITVSAIKDTDGMPGALGTSGDDQFASFSNYGDKVEISAPGVSIESTWKGGTYKTISGTSMASPHVAGAVAVIKHNNVNSMSFDDVLIEINARGIEQTSNPSIDVISDNGIDCSSDRDSFHEKLVYLGTLATVGTCTIVTPPAGSDPVPGTTATYATVDYTSKGGRMGVTVTLLDNEDDQNPIPNTVVTIELSREGSSATGEYTKTTDDSGKVKWNFVGVTSGTYSTLVVEPTGVVTESNSHTK
jgi:subtilisin